ncbi:MAG: hypothetical protein LKJ36_02560 [Lactobacillus sp.]|nr:hypothetical protein [Lactobacillus sp.]
MLEIPAPQNDAAAGSFFKAIGHYIVSLDESWPSLRRFEKILR